MSISLPSSCADPPSPAPHNFIFMYTSRARVVSTTILSFFSPSRARVSRARTGNSLTESSREQRGALCACLAAVQLCTERGHQRSTRGSLALFLSLRLVRSLARTYTVWLSPLHSRRTSGPESRGLAASADYTGPASRALLGYGDHTRASQALYPPSAPRARAGEREWAQNTRRRRRDRERDREKTKTAAVVAACWMCMSAQFRRNYGEESDDALPAINPACVCSLLLFAAAGKLAVIIFSLIGFYFAKFRSNKSLLSRKGPFSSPILYYLQLPIIASLRRAAQRLSERARSMLICARGEEEEALFYFALTRKRAPAR